MNSENRLRIYEIDRSELNHDDEQKMIVRNHWNRKAFVVVEIAGHSYTVEAAELSRAIQNATNCHSF